MGRKIISIWAAAMARRKARKMTKAQRSEHARKMALARWAKKRQHERAKEGQNEQV